MLKRFINKKAAFQLFFALSLVALITFSSNYIVFRNSASAIYDQTRENAKLTAKSMVKSFNECFKEVNNSIYAVNLLHYQVYEENGYENLNMSNIYLLVNDAKQLLSQDYISDFVVHFNQSSLAITSEGTAQFASIFEQKYKNIKYPPEFWKNFATAKHTMKIIASTYYEEVIANGGTYKRKLLGIVGNNKMSNSKFDVVIFIDEKKLLDRVNQQTMMEGASLLVLDQDKNVILNTDKEDNQDILGDINFNKRNEMSFRAGNFEYYCIKSDYNDFIYVNKIPYIYDSNMLAMKLNRIIMYVTILLALILCVLLSLYLYRPVKDILRLVENRKTEGTGSEFLTIYNCIKQLLIENQMAKSQLDTVSDEVRRSIFFRMIGSEANYKRLINQIEIYFKSVFMSRGFAMLSFQFEPESNKKDGKSSGAYFVNEDFIYTIQESLSRFFGSNFVFYMQNALFIALVGLDETTQRKNVIDNLHAIITELEKSTDPKCIINGALSRFYSEVYDCRAAYQDIQACIAYRSVKAKSGVIDYESLGCQPEIYYPADQVEKLSNYILCGNSKESKAIVRQIIYANVANGISHIKFTTVINNIFNNIINSLEVNHYEKSEMSRLEMEFFEKSGNMGNYEDMWMFFNTVLDQVTMNINQRKQSKLNKEFILEYIHLHYAEDLYLENMAMMTETSSKYFSNFFKKAMGVNFVEYLNKVRIHHAKEFLKNTEILVSEIGEKVGFSNSSTFTSTFKKYCGISPNEYRKDHRG